jgi:hypothetical protein
VMIFDIHKMEIRENHFSINGQRNAWWKCSFIQINRAWLAACILNINTIEIMTLGKRHLLVKYRQQRRVRRSWRDYIVRSWRTRAISTETYFIMYIFFKIWHLQN